MRRTIFLATALFVLLITAACQATQSTPTAITQSAADPESAPAQAQPSQEDQNLATVKRFYDEYAAGNADVILAVHPPTITMHYAGSAEQVPAQALRDDLAAIKEANPDLHAEIHTMMAAGDYVFTELTWTGTHTGDFFGITASGRPIVHNGIVVRRLAADKIVESWEIWDDLVLLQNLGFLPSWDEIIASGGLTTTVTSTVNQPTAPAPVVDKRPITPGMYLARINANPSLGVDGGYYAVRLDADDSYRIVWFGTDRSNLEAGNPGMEGVLGTYAITGDQVVFTDVEGFAACSAEEGVQGSYRFKADGNALRFTKLNDSCGARAHILSTQTLSLRKP